jgi:hypothetical protein
MTTDVAALQQRLRTVEARAAILDLMNAYPYATWPTLSGRSRPLTGAHQGPNCRGTPACRRGTVRGGSGSGGYWRIVAVSLTLGYTGV